MVHRPLDMFLKFEFLIGRSPNFGATGGQKSPLLVDRTHRLYNSATLPRALWFSAVDVKMELAWTYVKKKWWQHQHTGAQSTPQGHRGRGRPRNTWKDIWRKRCGQQYTSTAGGRWRRQHKTELDGDISGLWPMFHRERQGASQVNQAKSINVKWVYK